MERIKKIGKLAILLPAVLAVGFVPLIVTAKRYNIGLNGFDWFGSETSVDLFLYWKGQALILLAGLMLAGFLFYVSESERRSRLWQKTKVPAVAWLALYFLLAALSTLFSQDRDKAFWGSYEQWEGLLIIAAYAVLFLYTYWMVDSERAVRFLVYGLMIGSFVLGLIGTCQFMNMDLFRSEIGQAIMNLLSDKKLEYSFNFSSGWVYATLYNPNYVGSYAALVLPVVVGVAAVEWKKIPIFWTGLAMIDSCLLTVTLLGSQSVTGCVGVVASLIFLLVYMWPRLVNTMGFRKILAGAVGIGIFAAVAFFLFPEEIQYGINKIFHPTEDYHVIQQMISTGQGLQVTTVKGDVFYVEITGEDSRPFVVTGEGGEEIPLEKNTEKDYYTLQDERFDNFRLYSKEVTAEGKSYPAVRIFNPTINKEWTIAKVGENYMVYNAFGKLDEWREIPAWGFENNQHFGDKRGYIWSRTFPLLPNYMLLGCGPNIYTIVFPNDDYVGKTNMNYDGVIVTKPHNLYLQIWVQTGLLSLIAFLAMVLWYMVDSMKLYFNRPLTAVVDKLGLSIMIGIFGYLVTGLANDSTVAVAPVFWGLLGLGMAVNHGIKKGWAERDTGKAQ